MTIFYLTRHGETLFNTQGRYQGWCDSPLTEKGITEARALGIGLKDIEFVHACSSTSERAVDTMELILSGRHVSTEHRKDLREICFGDLEGERIAFNGDGWHEMFEKGFSSVHGESREESASRMLNALKSIAEQYPQGNVLIVSHGAILRYTALTVDKEKVLEFQKKGQDMDHCAIMILSYKDGNFQLKDFGNQEYKRKGEKK